MVLLVRLPVSPSVLSSDASNQKREQSKATGYLLPSILWPKLWRETNDKGLGQICNQLFCLLSQVQDSMMKRPRKTMHLVPLPQQIRRCALAFCQLITPKFFDLALAARSQDLLQSEENDQYVYIANRILLQVLLRDTNELPHKMQLQKLARRLRAKHIWQSKVAKHLMVGALLEDATSKSGTPPAREAHF